MDVAEKQCFKCEQVKPLSEFYKHPQMADGHVNKCKECNKVDVQKNYATRRPQYSEYDRTREQTPERREKKLEYQRRARARHPEKNSARAKVRRAILSGHLSKPTFCGCCGRIGDVEAHHTEHRGVEGQRRAAAVGKSTA